MDDQTRLLSEIRDLLAGIQQDNNEQAAKNEGWQERVERYEAQVHRYQYSLGATRTALWIIGAVEVAIVAWIVSRAGR